jgi:hypothetical protein
MPQVLQQLQLSVRPLAQNRCRERLHDLLDRDRRVGQLILCGAGCQLGSGRLPEYSRVFAGIKAGMRR